MCNNEKIIWTSFTLHQSACIRLSVAINEYLCFMSNQHPSDNLNITPKNKPNEDKQGNWKSQVVSNRHIRYYCSIKILCFIAGMKRILVSARFEFLTAVCCSTSWCCNTLCHIDWLIVADFPVKEEEGRRAIGSEKRINLYLQIR